MNNLLVISGGILLFATKAANSITLLIIGRILLGVNAGKSCDIYGNFYLSLSFTGSIQYEAVKPCYENMLYSYHQICVFSMMWYKCVGMLSMGMNGGCFRNLTVFSSQQ